MATVRDLFGVLSSYWKDHVEGEDHAFIEALWDGYVRSANDAFKLLYQYDLSKSIRTIQPTVERDWFHIDLAYTKATDTAYTYSIEEEITAIPVLQDGVGGPAFDADFDGVALTDTVDYTIDVQANTITFISAAAQELVSRVINLVDPLGNPTPTGAFIAGGGFSGLTATVDYTFLNVEETLVSLHSKAAFDLVAALEDGSSLGPLEDKTLFAPTLSIDEKLVYRNFGFLLGINPDDINVGVEVYTRIVKGLWYIAWNGPTPFNLSLGINVLFDYPVAASPGRVHSIIPDGTDTIVTVASPEGVLFDTTVPDNFLVTVVVGDTVVENHPLTDAVEILDELSSPGWYSALALARYSANRQHPKGLTAAEELELKGRLQNAVFGIRLKDSHDEPEINLRSQVMSVAAQFLRRLKPYYAQFAFLDDVVFVETTADEATGNDAALSFNIRKTIHQTIPDNHVNLLHGSFGTTSPFTDYQDYYDHTDPPTDADRAFFLSGDAPATTDELSLRVRYSGSGGMFVDVTDAGFVAYNEGLLADVLPPRLFLSPDPGVHYNDVEVLVRPDEPCQVLYTTDGTTPAFGMTPVGLMVRDRIPLTEGVTPLKLVARDYMGNVSSVLEVTYDVQYGLPPVRVTPPDGARSGDSVSTTFTHPDHTMRIFYTTDGRAPTDFVFLDVLRLGGHRIVWESPTSIRLEDVTRPVYFARGTSTENVDGPRSYEIAPARNTRYYVYADRLPNGTWKPSVSRENIRFELNTPSRLLLGFMISNASGEFTPESIVNAVDSGDVQEVVKNDTIVDDELNSENPVPVLNTQDFGILRFFGVTVRGLYTPVQKLVYEFDNIDPITVLSSSFTDDPFSKTLKLELAVEEGATAFYSTETLSPQQVIFGQPDRLVDGSNELAMEYTGVPNQVEPNFSTFNLTFRKFATTGEFQTIVTTADVRTGAPIDIPTDEVNTFYDIMAVPDFDNPSRWRLELGPVGTSLLEGSAAILVSRVFVDEFGVFDPLTDQGELRNATQQDNLSRLAKLSRKYVEPVLFNATGNYRIVFSYFAVDSAGNVEEIRTQVFEASE